MYLNNSVQTWLLMIFIVYCIYTVLAFGVRGLLNRYYGYEVGNRFADKALVLHYWFMDRVKNVWEIISHPSRTRQARLLKRHFDLSSEDIHSDRKKARNVVNSTINLYKESIRLLEERKDGLMDPEDYESLKNSLAWEGQKLQEAEEAARKERLI